MHLPAGERCKLCNKEFSIHDYRVWILAEGCVFMKISVISSTGAGRYCFFLGMVKNLLSECEDAVGYVDVSGHVIASWGTKNSMNKFS